jgi:hypothetical protein
VFAEGKILAWKISMLAVIIQEAIIHEKKKNLHALEWFSQFFTPQTSFLSSYIVDRVLMVRGLKFNKTE